MFCEGESAESQKKRKRQSLAKEGKTSAQYIKIICKRNLESQQTSYCLKLKEARLQAR